MKNTLILLALALTLSITGCLTTQSAYSDMFVTSFKKDPVVNTVDLGDGTSRFYTESKKTFTAIAGNVKIDAQGKQYYEIAVVGPSPEAIAAGDMIGGAGGNREWANAGHKVAMAAFRKARQDEVDAALLRLTPTPDSG